jgi:hypothetical protein
VRSDAGQAGTSEGLKTDLEGSGPAESDDADGLGEVPEHYPQAPGTRPVNHTKKEYARGDVHENRAESLFSLLKPYLRVFRGISKTTLPGYLGFFQFLRNFRQLNTFEQAEMILYAALDPAVASRARTGDFVRRLDHFDLLQTTRN